MLSSTFRHDLRVAGRQLRKSPGFTAVAILTLALGIGANVAIFSVVYGVMMRPLAIADPAGLAVVDLHREGDPADVTGFSPGHLADLRARVEGSAGIRRLTAFVFDSVTLHGEGAAEELGTALMVDGGFFASLGAEPLLGRPLAASDVVADRRGDVCVLGETLWRSRFGADPAIVGRVLVLDQTPVEVVGVMPSHLPLPQTGIDLWMPHGFDPEDRTLHNRLGVLARLEPGTALATAQEAIAAGVAELGPRHPRFDDHTAELRAFRDTLIGNARPALLAAAGAVGLVLLIACANMASLLLARAATREREIATRRALGARRRQLVAQMLVESLLLSTLGAAAGLALAFAGHRLLLGRAGSLLPRVAEIRLDLPVLGFAAAVALLTGLLFGLAPVAYAFTRDLMTAMRGSGGAARSGAGVARARRALVIAQVAVAVAMVAAAALMVRSLLALGAVEPGFRHAGVGGARIYLDDDAYRDDAQQAQYFATFLERLRARPDIAAAGASSGLPMDPLTIDYDLPYTIPGVDEDPARPRQAFFRTVTPGYLETVGIPLLRGRTIAASDHADGERVAVINATFARIGWPDGDPLGRTFAIYGGRLPLRVIGVVGDVRFAHLGDAPRAEFFVPHAQTTYSAMTVVARAGGEDTAGGARAAAAVAATALELDRAQPVHSTFVLSELLAGTMRDERFFTALLGAFAAIALALAAIGIYGVLAYWVAERRGEIGVRMALGADAGRVVALVLRSGLAAMALPGLLLGLALALAGNRALAPHLFGVRGSDGAVLATVVIVLALAALAACVAPALRAARVDPIRSLRQE